MTNKKFEIDLSINTMIAKQALKSLQGDFDDVSRRVNSNLGKSMDDLIKGSKTLKQTLREIAYDLAKSQISTYIGKSGGGGGGSLLGKILKGIGGLFFGQGGVVPGSFSQPVPVIAHGSEMILNPGQQANLFKMLNGQAKGGVGQSSYVYAPQVTTGASAQEVFEVLNRHSRQFFSMVAEGVQTNNLLRNAVRGA